VNWESEKMTDIALLLAMGPPRHKRHHNQPCEIPETIYFTWDYPPEPVNLGVGSISHVTPEQWEAAQGLYNSEVSCRDGKNVLLKYPDGSWRPYEHVDAMRMRSITIMCAPPYPALYVNPAGTDEGNPIGDTFQSGDAK
jgi:hypothetical protein